MKILLIFGLILGILENSEAYIGTITNGGDRGILLTACPGNPEEATDSFGDVICWYQPGTLTATSNIVTTIILEDSIPPGTITTLTIATVTSSSIGLLWYAPGDDGYEGTATIYDIRWATYTITSENWDSITTGTKTSVTQAAYGTETFTIIGLQPNTTYWSAIRTADEVLLWSALSNLATCTTRVFLGDFGRESAQPHQPPEEIPDNKIDYYDLLLFASYWNTQNPKGDIASTRTTGSAPNFTYEFDGKVDFEDLVYFAAMWNWYYQSNKGKLLLTAHKQPTTAMVRLKAVEVNDDEICLEIAVENISDLLAGRFVVKFDTEKLRLNPSEVTSRLSHQQLASDYTLFTDVDAQQGIIDIARAGLGKTIEEGRIYKMTFKTKSPINHLESAISIIGVDLRDMQTNHLPTQIVPLTSFPTDLTKAYCYPNPYITSKHTQQGITFAELTKDVRIRIFTIAGELVYDSGMLHLSESNYHWKPQDIASGIYLYLITNSNGQKKTGKVGIIR